MNKRRKLAAAVAMSAAVPFVAAASAMAAWGAGGDFVTGSGCTLRYSVQVEATTIWGSSVKVGSGCPAWLNHQVVLKPPSGSWQWSADSAVTNQSTASVARIAGAGKVWQVCVYSSNSISPNQQCTGQPATATAPATPASYVDNYSTTPPPTGGGGGTGCCGG